MAIGKSGIDIDLYNIAHNFGDIKISGQYLKITKKMKLPIT